MQGIIIEKTAPAVRGSGGSCRSVTWSKWGSMPNLGIVNQFNGFKNKTAVKFGIDKEPIYLLPDQNNPAAHLAVAEDFGGLDDIRCAVEDPGSKTEHPCADGYMFCGAALQADADLSDRLLVREKSWRQEVADDELVDTGEMVRSLFLQDLQEGKSLDCFQCGFACSIGEQFIKDPIQRQKMASSPLGCGLHAERGGLQQTGAAAATVVLRVIGSGLIAKAFFRLGIAEVPVTAEPKPGGGGQLLFGEDRCGI